jgi:hypothetical protein
MGVNSIEQVDQSLVVVLKDLVALVDHNSKASREKNCTKITFCSSQVEW